MRESRKSRQRCKIETVRSHRTTIEPRCRVRRQSGFTTVELLVTMALLLIVGGLSVVTFQVASTSRRQAMARIDVAEKSRVSLEMMSRELSSALVNQISLMPFPDGQKRHDYEDITNGVDDDGDGLVDEEEHVLIGKDGNRFDWQYGYPIGDYIDNDGPAIAGPGVQIVQIGNINMRKQSDFTQAAAGIDEEAYNGIDDDGDGMIDEDCMFPSDMLNFVIPASTADFSYSRSTEDPAGRDLTASPVYDLVEVGYALNPETSQLRRRYVTAASAGALGNLAIDGRFLVGENNPHEGDETDFVDVSQIFAFDIVGLDFRYYFYDYQIDKLINDPAMLSMMDLDANGDSIVFEILKQIGAQYGNVYQVNTNVTGREAWVLVFTDQVTDREISIIYPYSNVPWAYTLEWYSDRRDTLPTEVGNSMYHNINNEPDDAVLPSNTLSLANPEEIKEAFAMRRQEADGLPAFIEVTLFTYDRNRELKIPTRYTTRVYIAQR